MKLTLGLIVIVLLAPCRAGLSQAVSPEPSCSVAQCLSEISTAISRGEVGRVEILRVSPNLETRTRITPQALEHLYETKLVIRNIAETPLREKLTKALNQTSASPRDQIGDLRWAIVFFSQKDVRLGAFYFERWGHYGVVNDKGAAFDGSLLDWLKKISSGCPDN